MDNITLIGMPGVGKSTAGVILAKVLGYEFIDADLIIQKQQNRLLHEIIEQEGTERFLEIEEEANATIFTHKSVIATGGSVVYRPRAMEHLKSIGKVVYLKVSFDILNKRLKDMKGRGVVLKEGQTLKELYEERTALYETYADVIVNEDYKTVEETVSLMIEQLDKMK